MDRKDKRKWQQKENRTVSSAVKRLAGMQAGQS